MTRTRFLVTSCAVAIMTSPVLAQAPATPDLPDRADRARRGWEYGYGHMWGSPMWDDRWGWWHPGFFIGPVVMVLILIGFVAIVVSLVRWFSHSHDRHQNFGGGSRALDILEERFARGDIDKAEFEDRRRLLGR